jgi:hypothetical protein
VRKPVYRNRAWNVDSTVYQLTKSVRGRGRYIRVAGEIEPQKDGPGPWSLRHVAETKYWVFKKGIQKASLFSKYLLANQEIKIYFLMIGLK